jgi:hypothetical protein
VRYYPSSPLAKLLDAGRYGVVIDAVNERNFGKADELSEGTDPQIFSFESRTQFIETLEVIDLMGSQGYRPARLGDLLRYRIRHPRDSMNPKLVALDAVFKSGDREAAICLHGAITPGIVDLLGVLRDDSWEPETRFLGVRLPPGTVYQPPPIDPRLL